jgi:uncharacterized membrane protein
VRLYTSIFNVFCVSARSCRLIIIDKKYFWKYLIACLFAVILYIPHIPILIKQIQMGGVGGPTDGWETTTEIFYIIP